MYACIATLAVLAYLYKYPQYCVRFAELMPWVRFMLTSALQNLSTPMICKALRNPIHQGWWWKHVDAEKTFFRPTPRSAR